MLPRRPSAALVDAKARQTLLRVFCVLVLAGCADDAPEQASRPGAAPNAEQQASTAGEPGSPRREESPVDDSQQLGGGAQPAGGPVVGGASSSGGVPARVEPPVTGRVPTGPHPTAGVGMPAASGSPDIGPKATPRVPVPNANAEPCGGDLLGVKYSLERGWYSGDQMVSLSPCADAFAGSIEYSVGRDLPTTAYSGPIAIRDNGHVVTVRARFTGGGKRGRLHTHSYVFLQDVGGAVVVLNDSDLPVAVGEEETPVSFEFIPSPQTGLVPLYDEAATAVNRGGQSIGRSNKIYFRDEYGKGTLHGDVFGDLYYGIQPTLRHDHLYLRSDHTDRTMLRNIIAHDTLLAMGQLSPHGRLVDFYHNGRLRGTRYLHERPEGGFMESYTGIDKKQWTAVSGLDALGTLLAPEIQYDSWEEANGMVDVRSLVDFLLVQWHAGVKDYEPMVRNWRATGPAGTVMVGDAGIVVSAPASAGPDHRWHFFNWDIDRGYMREIQEFGSPMNVWERIEQFPEARAIFKERLEYAFSAEGPLNIDNMMARFRVRYDQLMTTSLLAEQGRPARDGSWPSHDKPHDLSPGVTPSGLISLGDEADRLLLHEIERWLVLREQMLFAEAFAEWGVEAPPPRPVPLTQREKAALAKEQAAVGAELPDAGD